jgi:regulator of sigma E protease
MSGLQHILTSLVAYVVAISLLVAVHEYGHFWVARRVGIKVLRFSIGFGKVIWKRVGRDGVEYALSAIPLGGYVRLLDERDGTVNAADLPQAFNRQAFWKKVLVLAAGPGFNFLFAIVAFWVIFMAGVADIKPMIGEVKPGSIAANAGLRANDTIVKVGEQRVGGMSTAIEKLVDELLNDDVIKLQVLGEDGASRNLTMQVQGRSRELTEPNALLNGLGFNIWTPPTPAILSVVTADGPAARAGLQAQDKLTSFDGIEIASFDQLSTLIHEHADRQIAIEYERDGSKHVATVILGHTTVNGSTRGVLGVGAMPVPMPESMRVIETRSALDALPAAVAETGSKIAFTFKIIWKLIVGLLSVKSISGPVGIASMAGQVVQYGVIASLTFLAVISVSVGVLNLLPIPMLDGGQIVHQLVELLNGGPVSERTQVLFQQIGIVLLVLLVGLVTYNDIITTSHT